MPTIKAQLLTFREDAGGYIIYVFKDLDNTAWDKQYRTTVRFPNWDAPYIEIGDVGFLDYKEVVAGDTTWWDRYTQTNKYYNYTNSIFVTFILEKPPTNEVML